jgi:hypothetical protein
MERQADALFANNNQNAAHISIADPAASSFSHPSSHLNPSL